MPKFYASKQQEKYISITINTITYDYYYGLLFQSYSNSDWLLLRDTTLETAVIS